MTAGVPTVASDIRMMRDFIKNDDNGVLFRVGDAEDLKLRLEKLLDDKELRFRISQKAKQDVELYNVENTALRLSSYYMKDKI